MTSAPNLAHVVRSWQLPLDLDAEVAAAAAVRALPATRPYSDEDLVLVLEQDTEEWAASGEFSTLLLRAIGAALAHVPASIAGITAKTYKAMYKRLRKGTADEAGLSHAATQRLLSRTALIDHLLTEERFSCSQVSRLLAATDASLTVPFASIQVVARNLRRLPTLDAHTVAQTMWDADQLRSLALFPDSDLAEASEIAADEVSAWLPEIDVALLLKRLSKSERPGADLTWPYLQIFHWCLASLEFFDHPATYLYEFSPRGVVGDALFEKYSTETGNAVLNNAKALESLNASWARSRGGDDAQALVALLAALEALPYLPRRATARVFRAWLMRAIELHSVTPQLLDRTVTADLFNDFVGHVIANETNTQGVIEQRVVDCLTALAHQDSRWRARGLGDGVNASNLSRRKLGDVEFADVNSRRAVAIEAHGGFLSATYVANHQRSLSRVLEQRLRESWGEIDEPGKWTVDVIFVAHGRAASGLPVAETLRGVNVTYSYIDYNELVAQARAGSTITEQIRAFERHVVDVLNRPTVRESAREKYRQIVSSF